MKSLLLALAGALSLTQVLAQAPTPVLEYDFTNRSFVSTGSNSAPMNVFGSIVMATGVDGDANGSFDFCCGSLYLNQKPSSLYAHNMTVVMQVNFKSTPPSSFWSYLFETRRNLTNSTSGYYGFYNHYTKQLVLGGGGPELKADIELDAGTWYEIAFVLDGNTGRRGIYVDGVKLTPDRSFYNNVSAHTNWQFGNSANANVQASLLSGYMDDLRVYDRGLSDGEIGGLVTGDFTAPTSVTNLRATATATTIAVAFDAATDDVGVTEYRASFNGRDFVSLGTDLTADFTGLAPELSYSVDVYALDATGNRSANERVIIATTALSPPTAPANLRLSELRENAFTVAFDAATDDVGVVGYRAKLSSGAVRELGTDLTVTFGGLQVARTYTAEVWAYDADGAESPRASITATTPDQTPPTLPGIVNFSRIEHHRASFNFASSSDQVGVTEYFYTLNGGAAVSLGTRTNTILVDLAPATAYAMEVYAVDAAGNEGPRRAATFTTSRTDLAPPTDLAVASKSDTEIVMTYARSAADTRNDFNYLVALDGEVIASSTVGSGTPTFRFGDLAPNTTYTLGVRARNGDFDISPFAEITVTTELAPDVMPPSAVANLRLVRVGDDEAEIAFDPATDDRGVARYLLSIPGITPIDLGTSTQRVITDLASGAQYRVRVQAEDAAGNRGTAVSLDFTTIDSEAPGTVTGIRTIELSGTRAVIAFDPASDNVAVTSYSYRMAGSDDPVGINAGTSFTLEGLTPANEYSLSVRAFDASGNGSAATDFSFSTPDDVAPTAVADLQLTDVTAEGFRVAFAAATDNVGVAEYFISVDGGAAASLELRRDTILSQLQPNTAYTVAVYAVDASGNRSANVEATATTMGASSVAAATLAGFGVSPNPVAASGTVQLTAVSPQDHVTVVDVHGRAVFRTRGASLETTGLAAGLYVVHVRTVEGLRGAAKLVVR